MRRTFGIAMNCYEPGSFVIKAHAVFPKVRRTFIGPYHFEWILKEFYGYFLTWIIHESRNCVI